MSHWMESLAKQVRILSRAIQLPIPSTVVVEFRVEVDEMAKEVGEEILYPCCLLRAMLNRPTTPECHTGRRMI